MECIKQISFSAQRNCGYILASFNVIHTIKQAQREFLALYTCSKVTFNKPKPSLNNWHFSSHYVHVIQPLHPIFWWWHMMKV